MESPTSASIVLASVLLKLGTYGFFVFTPVLHIIDSGGILFVSVLGSLVPCAFCCFSADTKVLAAYSSVSHINFVLLLLLIRASSLSWRALILMLAHGYVSALLFYIAGFLYRGYGTRLVYISGGL